MISTSDILRDYRLDALTGRGAFGDIYLAEHIMLRAPRAMYAMGSVMFDMLSGRKLCVVPPGTTPKTPAS